MTRSPGELRVSPPPEAQLEPVRSRRQAEGYVAMICFKHGPPRLHGVELEWTVHHRHHPRRPLTSEQLARALGPYAPASINPASAQIALPGGSLVTVEPGGQVEISSLPYASVAGLVTAVADDAAFLETLLGAEDLELGQHGTDPHRPPAQLLRLPRYDAMRAAFDRIGPHGAQMMCSTTSAQVCLDAGEPDQIATRWRAAHAIAPALIALFANSTDLGGRRTGWASCRARAAFGTCPPVTMPPASYEDPAANWAHTAMNAPVICVRGGASWAAPTGLNFARWIDQPALVGRQPTFDDLDYHLTTLFPPVRPKGYLEIRYLDSQPENGRLTPLVLVAALMAQPTTIDRALDLADSTCHRWLDAARYGLDDPELRRTAERLILLGLDFLHHLDLDPEQHATVEQDLEARLATSSAQRRYSR